MDKTTMQFQLSAQIRIIIALALVTGFAALTLFQGSPAVSADNGRDHNRTAIVTFTKWVTTYPNMAGVVGGDVGRGEFAGEILSRIVSADGALPRSRLFTTSRAGLTPLLHAS